jgi:hypothetical protein
MCGGVRSSTLAQKFALNPHDFDGFLPVSPMAGK